MQEDGVERDPCCWRETKTDVADPQHHVNPGEVFTDHANGVDSGLAIEPVFLDAGGNRQRQWVVKDFMGRDAELQGIAIGPLGDGKLFLSRASHAVFIDGSNHHASAVATRQLKHLEEAFVPVLIVGRVEDALTPSNLEASFHFLPLGGVEHQRQVDVGDQTAHQLMHILLAIATDVVDVDVQNVSVLLDLTPGHGHQSVPVLFRQQFAHLAAATGVEPFPDDQEGVVLLVRGNPVDRCRSRFVVEGRTDVRIGGSPVA